MPMVGKMEFPYTAAGKKAAMKAVKATGKPMKKATKKTVMKKMGKKK
jgi:hypothetical protein